MPRDHGCRVASAKPHSSPRTQPPHRSTRGPAISTKMTSKAVSGLQKGSSTSTTGTVISARENVARRVLARNITTDSESSGFRSIGENIDEADCLESRRQDDSRLLTVRRLRFQNHGIFMPGERKYGSECGSEKASKQSARSLTASGSRHGDRTDCRTERGLQSSAELPALLHFEDEMPIARSEIRKLSKPSTACRGTTPASSGPRRSERPTGSLQDMASAKGQVRSLGDVPDNTQSRRRRSVSAPPAVRPPPSLPMPGAVPVYATSSSHSGAVANCGSPQASGQSTSSSASSTKHVQTGSGIFAGEISAEESRASFWAQRLGQPALSERYEEYIKSLHTNDTGAGFTGPSRAPTTGGAPSISVNRNVTSEKGTSSASATSGSRTGGKSQEIRAGGSAWRQSSNESSVRDELSEASSRLTFGNMRVPHDPSKN